MHNSRHYLDEKLRKQMMEPEQILAEVGLTAGMTLADLGCGEGYFAVPAAVIAGPAGRIYAVDTNQSAVDKLSRRAEAEGLANLTLKVAEAEKTVFCRGCVDIVFLGIVLHDFQNPGQVLANALQMLKPAGKLVNLDWKKQDSPFGPPLAIRFDEAQAGRLIEEAGFKIESVRDSGQYHYLIQASPAK